MPAILAKKLGMTQLFLEDGTVERVTVLEAGPCPVTGVAKLPEGTEMVMPGDNVQMEIELIQPIAMDEGLRFAVREGGRTVGAGVVTKITK